MGIQLEPVHFQCFLFSAFEKCCTRTCKSFFVCVCEIIQNTLPDLAAHDFFIVLFLISQHAAFRLYRQLTWFGTVLPPKLKKCIY